MAVFAAGLGVRFAEVRVVENNPIDNDEKIFEEPAETKDNKNNDLDEEHKPAENLVDPSRKKEAMKKPAVVAGVVVSEVITFGETAERILEVFLVVVIGICVWNYWDWRALPLAFVFFFLIRPILTQIFLLKTSTTNSQRLMLGWFGVRGIGSIYYLSYALSHGLESNVIELISLVISIITISILVHGLSSQPILKWYENSIRE